MTKQELIDALAAKTGLPKVAITDVIEAQASIAKEALAAGRAFEIHRLVSIKPVQKAARTGRNPMTGEAIEIPAKVVAKATAAKSLMGA